jgi:hypothetical protein
MVVFRKFDTPQDIYVFGTFVDHELLKENKDMDDSTFGITDDYHSLELRNKEQKRSIETCGFAYVFTAEQFEKAKAVIGQDEDLSDYDNQVFIFKNFTGEFRLKILSEAEDGRMIDVFDVYEPPTEYLMYQSQARKRMEDEDLKGMDFVLEVDCEIPKPVPISSLL